MDMVGYMAEIVLVSFLVGGVVGAVITAHLLVKPRQVSATESEAVPVKVKAKR
ncbi:MAG: hypothetical protein OEW58_02400 [Gammaproteobacteria bacterium]|nr:hypothetical protein [Gammaproteobacteria bacterium]